MTAPEQHAGDGEVRETADALRHQLQLRLRHIRVHSRGRAEGCQQARVKLVPGTRAGHPWWAGILGRGVLRERSSMRGGRGGTRRGRASGGVGCGAGGLWQEVAHLLEPQVTSNWKYRVISGWKKNTRLGTLFGFWVLHSFRPASPRASLLDLEGPVRMLPQSLCSGTQCKGTEIQPLLSGN